MDNIEFPDPSELTDEDFGDEEKSGLVGNLCGSPLSCLLT